MNSSDDTNKAPAPAAAAAVLPWNSTPLWQLPKTTCPGFDTEPPSWFVSMGEASKTIKSSLPTQVTLPQQHEGAGSAASAKEPETKLCFEQASVATNELELAHAPAEVLETEWLKISEEDSSVTIQRIGLGSSFVTVGAGLDVRSIKCGFDTCIVEMKNVPLGLAVKTLETFKGVKRRSFRVLKTQLYGDGSQRVVMLAQKDTALKLASKLDGHKFKSDKALEFNVVGHNSLPGIQSIMSNILTISWDSPPMVAVLSYRDPREAHKFAEQLNKEGFGGRKLQAHVTSRTSGLQAETIIKTSEIPHGLNCFQLHSQSKAQSIVIQAAFDIEDMVTGIKQTLSIDDSVQMFYRTVSCAGKMFGVLNITFNAWNTVKRAHDLLTGRRIKPWYPVLRCYMPFSKPIQCAAYIPLEPSLAHSWDDLPERHRSDASISSMHSNWGCIPPVDDNVQNGSLDVQVEKLGSDETLSYWNWACSSMPLLHNLHSHGVSFVELCWTTRTLKVFAEDRTVLAKVVQVLRAEVVKSTSVQRVITSDRRLIRSLRATGALTMLKQKFGTDGLVSLDCSPTHSILKYRTAPSPRTTSAATQAFITKQKEQIYAHQSAWQEDDTEVTCPVCLDDPSGPEASVQRLSCGHVYCSPCLAQFLATAPERNKFPLVCIGNEDRCKATISIPMIQSLLSPQQFDTLLNKALSAYVEHKPDQYKYCPTPNCTQLYRCTSANGKPGSETAAFCPACLVHTCTMCHKGGHPGLTCAERRERDPNEHDALNTEWASTHGAKRCPACQVWIQKTEGCNHVTCRCGAHICWICGRSFHDAQQTYRHLRAEHPEQTLPYGYAINVQHGHGNRGPMFGRNGVLFAGGVIHGNGIFGQNVHVAQHQHQQRQENAVWAWPIHAGGQGVQVHPRPVPGNAQPDDHHNYRINPIFQVYPPGVPLNGAR